MKQPIKTFSQTFTIFKKDKLIILLSMVPVLIGLAFYYYVGSFFYGDLLKLGNEFVKANVSSEGLGSVLSWLLTGFLTIALFFLVNWTFVLFVSIIASPFNDLISGRVERQILSLPANSLDSERFFSKFFKIIFNEAKKIALILFLSIVAFITGLFLPPLGFAISALLLSVSFLDYAWSRKDLSFGECVTNVRSSFFTYLITGCAFMALISIPIVNLFVLPFAVVYYSALYYSKIQLEKA
ncbi:EI24 domain-containing protein [Halobacteriovorax sp. HLS]|uniref:EI24 domain-containing protein n=1 Tax=Halobacteriovorax sp. HLS TaxID=2234000 RepID=UPI0013E28CCF|nr:EI24 domain-containing protein [Halobacteriovorax sp. HLS]